jgi:hypothetical protein
MKKQLGHRRHFIRNTMVLIASAASLPVLGHQQVFSNKQEFLLAGGDDKIPPIPADMVYEFVRVSHGNIQRVKEMLEKEPGLVNASWDWGGGDFETALGAASHVGSREVASHLLQLGAREDIFHAAMSGKRELVKSFVTGYPAIVNSPGPHKLTLLYHVAISGDTDMAAVVKPHISKINVDANKALHAAVRAGHVAMSEWLLTNGVDDPNTTDFKGSTPFQSAEKNANKELAGLIKKYGGK